MDSNQKPLDLSFATTLGHCSQIWMELDVIGGRKFKNCVLEAGEVGELLHILTI